MNRSEEHNKVIQPFLEFIIDEKNGYPEIDASAIEQIDFVIIE